MTPSPKANERFVSHIIEETGIEKICNKKRHNSNSINLTSTPVSKRMRINSAHMSSPNNDRTLVDISNVTGISGVSLFNLDHKKPINGAVAEKMIKTQICTNITELVLPLSTHSIRSIDLDRVHELTKAFLEDDFTGHKTVFPVLALGAGLKTSEVIVKFCHFYPFFEIDP